MITVSDAKLDITRLFFLLKPAEDMQQMRVSRMQCTYSNFADATESYRQYVSLLLQFRLPVLAKFLHRCARSHCSLNHHYRPESRCVNKLMQGSKFSELNGDYDFCTIHRTICSKEITIECCTLQFQQLVKYAYILHLGFQML